MKMTVLFYYQSDWVFKCFDFIAFQSNLQAAYHLRAFLAFLAAVIPLESVFSRSSLEGTRPRVRSLETKRKKEVCKREMNASFDN